MKFHYAVLGAGRQGVATAYDLARFGDAEEVRLVDLDPEAAVRGAEKINTLLQAPVAKGKGLDVRDASALVAALQDIDSTVSAVPYALNPAITEAAIAAGSNICDLGGHTDTVRKQLALGDKARAAGISITPDCGMGPGLNINMGIRAMDSLDAPENVFIWDGGLPQNPQPPWNYQLAFNFNGLINEYYGEAWFIRDGEPTAVPCLTEIEILNFPQPLGVMEAAVTSGGLSTAPWTFQGKLQRLENKTLRYPGHWEQFIDFQKQGLFELEPVEIDGQTVVPREKLEALLAPEIIPDSPVRDICIIRTRAIGRHQGSPASCTLELQQTYDKKTGFTAMEQLTGWHASIIAILGAQGQLAKGAVPVELTLRGKRFDAETAKRGWQIKIKGPR